MPGVGIIHGYGEAERETRLLAELIAAVNRRFRSRLSAIELPIGNCEKYAAELSDEAVSLFRDCGAVFLGDISARANLIDYTVSDIAALLGNRIEFLCVRGNGNHAGIDVNIASYFDGGAPCRHSRSGRDGCFETRTAPRKALMDAAAFICRECERRRRKVVFVKDSENEFLADMFYKCFEDFIFPISNFYVIKTEARDICEDALFMPEDFDVIVASKTTTEALYGVYSFIMGEDFNAYYRFAGSKSVYFVPSLRGGAAFGRNVAAFDSCVTALGDMLENEFSMKKEAFCLRTAAAAAAENGFASGNAEEYLREIIKELGKPMTTKFKKPSSKPIYLR